MKSINESISKKMNSFTRGQKLLAAFISEHCDKAAFMSSFELADYTGVSQSTVIRFSQAMGYDSFTHFQTALQTELKYRLNSLERFEFFSSDPEDDDVVSKIALTDARNIKKNFDESQNELLKCAASRILLADKIYIYGQGIAQSAAIYLSSYLHNMLPNVCCINQTGLDPVSAAAHIGEGDLLISISFPLHSSATMALLDYTKSKNASVITISESCESQVSDYSDLSLASEYGDYGINGTLAPVISLCGAIVSVLAHSDDKYKKRLHKADSISTFREENR